MIDTQGLREAVDLRALAEQDTALTRVANSGGGEYAGACPFCGGRDRFRVQPEARRWLCRACTSGAWQDAIAYVERREHCDFRRACEILGGERLAKVGISQRRENLKKPEILPTPCPTAAWQQRARAFVETSAAALWSDNGTRARAWLHGRGLEDDTLAAWRIGYHAADRWEEPRAWDLPEERGENGRAKRVWLPRGVVIPCEAGGTVHYVKVRRPAGEPKYYKLTGSRVGLFGAANFSISQGETTPRAAVFCEGELDALLLWQHAQDLAAIGTFGSATDKPGNEWARYLLPIPLWLLAYDTDPAGERAAAWWIEYSERTRRALVPRICEHNKDLTDFWQSGGELRAWLAFELAKHGITAQDTGRDNGTRAAMPRGAN